MKETVYFLPAHERASIAFLADTHNIDPYSIVASLKARHLDIITISGDILIGRRPVNDELIVKTQDNVLPLITNCVSIAPTFISLGNHEWMICPEDIVTLESTGAVVLDNRFISHTVNGMRIWVGGLTSAIVTNFQQFREKEGGRYPYRPRRSHPSHLDTNSRWIPDFEKQDGYKVLLCHHPEYWSLREPWLSEKQIDLVLSGHAHGGQIRLFGRGLYAPDQGWMPEYTSGVYKGDHGSMVVSRGLSNTASPIPRLFTDPEIVYVEVGVDD